MGILTYIKLGVLAVALGAVAYFVWDYRSLKRENTEYAVQVEAATVRIRDAETRLVEQVKSSNAALAKLKEEFYAEREQRKLTERNYAEANDRITDLMADSQEEKAKYESGRLARLAAAKGGLLTRLAATGAKKRNTEWTSLNSEWQAIAP